MRVFENVSEAIPEIRRDLSKGPVLSSNRVQHIDTTGDTVQELQNYSYTILAGGVPGTTDQVVKLYKEHFPGPIADDHYFGYWLSEEGYHRFGPYSDRVGQAPDRHTILRDMKEGEHYSYTYGERMVSAVDQMVEVLKRDMYSRRAYWPIFQPLDALRAPAYTRIPCSLGYQLTIREIPGVGDALHMTYISRSCDFSKFWLSDLYFADQFKMKVLEILNGKLWERLKLTSSPPYPGLIEGSTSHVVLSLHRFADDNEELF